MTTVVRHPSAPQRSQEVCQPSCSSRSSRPARSPRERTSSVKAAESYSGRMLLIHGTHDDNVHPQNTIQLVDALIKSRKPFDLMLYPGKTHGIRGEDATIHLWTMVYDYLERHLK